MAVSNLEQRYITISNVVKELKEKQISIRLRKEKLVEEIKEDFNKLKELGINVSSIDELRLLKENLENSITQTLEALDVKLKEIKTSSDAREEVKEMTTLEDLLK